MSIDLLVAVVMTRLTTSPRANPPEIQPPSVRYFKEMLPGAISTTRFVVETVDGAAPALPADGAFRIDHHGPSAPGFTAIVAGDAPGLDGELDSLRTDGRTRFVTPLVVHPDGGWRAPTSRIVIRFEKGVDDQLVASALRGAGEVLERDVAGLSNAYLVETNLVDGVDVLRRADELTDLAIVRFAEPEYLLSGEPLDTPNDPLFASLWGLHNTGQAPSPCSGASGVANVDINGPEAWSVASGDQEVLVVVIDNGVQFDHPDLLALPALGFDITGQNGEGWPVVPCDNHGTAVAGCIAALRNNGLGICGIASGVRIASARISTVAPACSPWTVNPLWVAGALDWSVSIGARITNTSWYFESSAVIADAYAATEEEGLLHFVAAGNFASSISFPANIPSTVAVGAITKSGAKASFSNTGPDLEFAAPGSQIHCLDRTGSAGYESDDYACIDGTSFASPYVAGVAAHMLSVNPSLSGRQVRTLMKTATTDLGAPGWDPNFGWGLPRTNTAGAIAALPADLDRDGHVGGADLSLLLGLWGSTGPLGDLTGDGGIGGDDLTILLGSWETR